MRRIYLRQGWTRAQALPTGKTGARCTSEYIKVSCCDGFIFFDQPGRLYKKADEDFLLVRDLINGHVSPGESLTHQGPRGYQQLEPREDHRVQHVIFVVSALQLYRETAKRTGWNQKDSYGRYF